MYLLFTTTEYFLFIYLFDYGHYIPLHSNFLVIIIIIYNSGRHTREFWSTVEKFEYICNFHVNYKMFNILIILFCNFHLVCKRASVIIIRYFKWKKSW